MTEEEFQRAEMLIDRIEVVQQQFSNSIEDAVSASRQMAEAAAEMSHAATRMREAAGTMMMARPH